MALTYETVVGPDGVPRLNVTSDLENPHIVLTGPEAKGIVRTSDGAVYDVTPPAIEVASPQHAGEVNHHIGVQHEEAGRYGLAPEPVVGTHPLTGEEDVLIGAPHECTKECGKFKVARPVHTGHLGLHKTKVAALLKQKG